MRDGPRTRILSCWCQFTDLRQIQNKTKKPTCKIPITESHSLKTTATKRKNYSTKQQQQKIAYQLHFPSPPPPPLPKKTNKKTNEQASNNPPPIASPQRNNNIRWAINQRKRSYHPPPPRQTKKHNPQETNKTNQKTKTPHTVTQQRFCVRCNLSVQVLIALIWKLRPTQHTGYRARSQVLPQARGTVAKTLYPLVQHTNSGG